MALFHYSNAFTDDKARDEFTLLLMSSVMGIIGELRLFGRFFGLEFRLTAANSPTPPKSSHGPPPLTPSTDAVLLSGDDPMESEKCSTDVGTIWTVTFLLSSKKKT